MFARSLALFCLFSAASTALSVPAPKTLAVYLNPSSSLSALVGEPMKRELAQLMQTAGYSPEWFDASTPIPSSGVPLLAVVGFDGSCSLPPGGAYGPAETGNLGRLASTAVSNGHVLPFISVDCNKLTNLLAPSLASEPAARGDYLYGRALARVVAHELYHALLDTPCHSRNGIAKAAFTARDLLSVGFAFEEDSLVRLETRAAESFPNTVPSVVLTR
jgi:hypothetical protein